MPIKKTKDRKAEPKPTGPLPPFPRPDLVEVIQFQFFDNSHRPKQGQCRYTLKLEVYYGEKLNLRKPRWFRVVGLLEPAKMTSWANEKFADGSITKAEADFYGTVVDLADAYMAAGDTEWVKVGYIEDRRAKLRYPGQAVVLRRGLDKSMQAHVLANDEAFTCPRFIFDKFWKPGSDRRIFYGFFDPHGVYAKTKAVDAWEAEIATNGVASRPAMDMVVTR